MPLTTAEKRAAFRALHREGCFVIPNPWDVGSARMLQPRDLWRWRRPVRVMPGAPAGRLRSDAR